MSLERLLNRNLEIVYGQADQISLGIRRVVANNPGPFTFKGTGTYIIGRGEVAVVDPGPLDADHLAALDAALVGETVTHILVTHTHSDHSSGAEALRAKTGAITYGFGPHPFDDEPADPIVEQPPAPDGAEHQINADASPKSPEDGHDSSFLPEVSVSDGTVIRGSGWTVECVHTPGHLANHICYSLADEHVLFTGDHVMGWSTTVISPPGGDMAAYFSSLGKLLPRADVMYIPTHGAPITDPKPYVEALIEHRRAREHAILERLQTNDRLIADIVAVLYIGIDEKLHKAAGRSVLAHLRHLVAQGRVRWEPSERALAERAAAPESSAHVWDRPMVDSTFLYR